MLIFRSVEVQQARSLQYVDHWFLAGHGPPYYKHDVIEELIRVSPASIPSSQTPFKGNN
jgi:hypothetical protein